jgi:hypothetical protein
MQDLAHQVFAFLEAWWWACLLFVLGISQAIFLIRRRGIPLPERPLNSIAHPRHESEMKRKKVEQRLVTLDDFRPSFLIGLLVAWNVLCISGVVVNGGPGPIHSASSGAFVALAFALITIASFGSIASPRIRSVVLEPAVLLPEIKKHLTYLGILGLTPSVIIAIVALHALR